MSPGRGTFFPEALVEPIESLSGFQQLCPPAVVPRLLWSKGEAEALWGLDQGAYFIYILKNDNTVCLKFRLNWASSIYLATLTRDKAIECCPCVEPCGEMAQGLLLPRSPNFFCGPSSSFTLAWPDLASAHQFLCQVGKKPSSWTSLMAQWI